MDRWQSTALVLLTHLAAKSSSNHCHSPPSCALTFSAFPTTYSFSIHSFIHSLIHSWANDPPLLLFHFSTCGFYLFPSDLCQLPFLSYFPLQLPPLFFFFLHLNRCRSVSRGCKLVDTWLEREIGKDLHC